MTSGGLPSVLEGRGAERRAANWLRRRGYRILASNYRIRGGELDLVVSKNGTLCFVEVKARGEGSWSGALEALHPGQLQRVVRAAQCYLVSHPHDGPCRFDIVTLEPGPEDGDVIRHLRDAFSLDDLW